MAYLVRFLIGTALFVVVLLVGYALGIHPTFAEIVLVAIGTGLSNGVIEALK